MPAVSGVKETCLHVENLARARAFYEGVMGFPVVAWDQRFCAYDVGGQSVLELVSHRAARLRDDLTTYFRFPVYDQA